MNVKTSIGAFAAAGLTLATVVALPASADLVTRCVGTGGKVTVPGDLVVPKGQSCSLQGTTVQGRVRVLAGADLVAVDATFKGAVSVAPDGYLDTTTTSIAGPVTSRGGYGVYLDRSTLSGDYRGRASGDTQPFAYFIDSAVGGKVDVRTGQLLLDTAKVGGAVQGRGTVYVDVINSTLAGALTVTGNAEGSVICASEVDGKADFSGNTGVQVGGGDLLSQCNDVNYFGGDLTVSNNKGGVTVTDNIIRGNLAGTGNDPAPTGSGNRVRGTSTGQFADLPVTPPAPAVARTKRVAEAAQAETTAPVDHTEQAAAKIAQRRSAAKAEAWAAGPANLA